ncbi:MAG TPA: NAD(P)/FAD-dependent oxidoreductase [bacterium]
MVKTQEKNLKSEYDAIIIGAGIAGLTCGNYLAKAGLNVLIAEKHYIAGGYCSSFKKKGFYFDAAAHYLSSCRERGQVGRLLRDHQLDGQLELMRSDPSDVVLTSDRCVQIRTKFSELISEFQRHFPKEATRIREFFKFMRDTDALTLYVTLKSKTFAEVLDGYFSDRKLKGVISILLGNIGLPSTRASALSGVFLFREFVFDGGYYPKGGMQSFVDILVGRFQKYGGTISFLTPITSVVVKHGLVQGVRIRDQLIRTRHIVATCDPHQLFSMLAPPESLNGYSEKVLHGMEPSISAFMIHIGTKKSIKEQVLHKCCVWYYPDYDIDACYLDWVKGKPNFTRGFVFASFPSFHDHNLAPPGKDSLQLIVGSPFMTREYWKQYSEAVSQKVIKHAESFIPNLSNNIEVQYVATPMTLVKYTGNYQGAMYGWASTPTQVGEGRFPETTPITGLLLAGHWAGPPAGQGGIPMVVYSGRSVASRVLREKRPSPLFL